MRGYYRRWIKVASIGHSWGLAETATGVLGAIVAVAAIVLRMSDVNRAVSDVTSLITVGICLALFLFRLIAAPYWMHLEDEAERQTERDEDEKKHAASMAEQDRLSDLLDTRAEDRRRRAEQMECLAELMKEGDRLRAENINASLVAEWVPRYQEWIGRVEAEIGRRFSTSDASRLIKLVYTIDYNVGVSGPHQRAIARIAAILQEMHAMSRSLSAQD